MPGSSDPDGERARVNATRTIRRALRHIASAHPALGRHLETTVKTSTTSAYVPDPRAEIRWVI